MLPFSFNLCSKICWAKVRQAARGTILLRAPSEKDLREAERVLSLSPVQQKNHPSAVAADHSKLSHISTYGSLPNSISIGHSSVASVASEKSGKPKLKSGTMRRPRVMLMHTRLSAMHVVSRGNMAGLAMTPRANPERSFERSASSAREKPRMTRMGWKGGSTGARSRIIPRPRPFLSV